MAWPRKLRKRKHVLLRRFAVLLLIACAFLFFFLRKVDPPQTDSEIVETASDLASSPITSLGDGLYSYKGVDTQHGPQCVEYAERFYVKNYPGTFPFHNSGPGAYDIWDGIANNKDVGGWNQNRKYFVAYKNGETQPRPDDMLLYDRTRGEGWGHIAIIAEVHPNYVVLLDQNSRWDTRKKLKLDGNTLVDNGVKGVVRLKKNNDQ